MDSALNVTVDMYSEGMCSEVDPVPRTIGYRSY